MLQRGWGTLSAEEGGGEIPHRTINKQARPEKAGVAAHAQQSGAGKFVKVVVGGKLHRRGGRPTSHVNCK
jgi:hypothetical protein